MSWSTRRRLIILAVILLVVGGVAGGVGYLTLHKAPSCTDGTQNQKEEGVDCGGSCPYLCTASQTPPSVRFVRALSPVPGRTDVVAYIDNPNPTSATQSARFTIELYDDQNVLIARKNGTTPIPAGGTIPVFMPDFFSGSQTVARVFLTFDTATIPWFATAKPSVAPKAQGVLLTPGDTPRVTATVSNPTAVAMTNVPFVVTIFGADGNAIAASRTIAARIPPQGQTQIVFTWPAAFSAVASRVDVVPLVVPTP